MKELHLYVNEIIVKDGRRAIDQGKVKELAESIKQVGLLHPITVRADDKGTYTLIAGAHRLEAFKLLGKESIESKVIMKNDLQTELIEIDENLIRNELHYTEIGELLRRKKEIYEDLYPETKAGGDRGNQYTGGKSRNPSSDRTKTETDNNVTAEIAPTLKPSFVADTAAKTGRSETVIKEDLQIANKVIPEAKAVLKEKEIPKTEAVKLARETPEVQKKIIPIFESGQAKRVEEAKKIIDPIDEAYDKIVEDIEAKDKRVKKVMKLLNYTQFLGITEQSIQDYFDVFPKNRDSFTKDLERLKTIINETIEIYNDLQQIRRVK